MSENPEKPENADDIESNEEAGQEAESSSPEQASSPEGEPGEDLEQAFFEAGDNESSSASG